MRVKAIISFNAFNIMANVGDEFEIEDKGIRLDLEKLGWIEPAEHKAKIAKKAKSE